MIKMNKYSCCVVATEFEPFLIHKMKVFDKKKAVCIKARFDFKIA